MQLQGKTALVTGGGRGIGRAIALDFAKQGASVCAAARSKSQVDAVAQEIQSMGCRAIAVECDVTDLAAVERMVGSTIESLGSIDILVNNAGGGEERKMVGDDDPVTWKHVIEVNLLGTYFVSRAVLPHMKSSGGGAIINIGSGMGHQARAGNSSYNAAKAAQWMFTRCLAMEVWQDNITVNEIIPGPVYTELTASVFQQDQPHPVVESEWVKGPDEVAPLAVFLAAQGKKGPTAQSFSLARRPL